MCINALVVRRFPWHRTYLHRSRRFRVRLAALALATSATATASPAPVFKAGAAASNITPPLGIVINCGMQNRTATHVHDELHARCLVLDNGSTQLAFVVIDSCVIERKVFDAAKRLVLETTGLPLEHMTMSATHAHSCGPLARVHQAEADPEYVRFVVQRIADGVRRARNNLAPARIGWGFGEVPGQVFNRRWKMKPGTIPSNPFGKIEQVMTNPTPGSRNLVEPAAPTDPQVWFISVRGLDGRAIALLANYSLHYVGGVRAAHAKIASCYIKAGAPKRFASVIEARPHEFNRERQVDAWAWFERWLA